MNKIDTSKKEMFELLELITEQAEMLKLHQGEIPQLYIDLLKKNVLKFYESIHTIDQIKHLEENFTKTKDLQTMTEKLEIEKELAKPTPIIPELKKPITQNEPETVKAEKAEPPMPEIKNEVKKEENIIELEEKPEITFSIHQTSEKPTEKEVFIHPNSDLFSEPKPSIADKLSAKKDPSLGEKMQQNQINDIKSAIGINDKFLFINELFEGNLKNYNQAVEQLNLASNKEEAMSSFNSFQEKFNWPEKDEAVVKLKTILNRKFSLV